MKIITIVTYNDAVIKINTRTYVVYLYENSGLFFKVLSVCGVVTFSRSEWPTLGHLSASLQTSGGSASKRPKVKVAGNQKLSALPSER